MLDFTSLNQKLQNVANKLLQSTNDELINEINENSNKIQTLETTVASNTTAIENLGDNTPVINDIKYSIAINEITELLSENLLRVEFIIPRNIIETNLSNISLNYNLNIPVYSGTGTDYNNITLKDLYDEIFNKYILLNIEGKADTIKYKRFNKEYILNGNLYSNQIEGSLLLEYNNKFTNINDYPDVTYDYENFIINSITDFETRFVQTNLNYQSWTSSELQLNLSLYIINKYLNNESLFSYINTTISDDYMIEYISSKIISVCVFLLSEHINNKIDYFDELFIQNNNIDPNKRISDAVRLIIDILFNSNIYSSSNSYIDTYNSSYNTALISNRTTNNDTVIVNIIYKNVSGNIINAGMTNNDLKINTLNLIITNNDNDKILEQNLNSLNSNIMFIWNENLPSTYNINLNDMKNTSTYNIQNLQLFTDIMFK